MSTRAPKETAGRQAGAGGALQLTCTAGGAAYFPTDVSQAALRSAHPDGLPVGPLLPGETLACALGASGGPANTNTCSASFAQLSAPVACPAAQGAPGFQLLCSGCAVQLVPAPEQPAPVLCAARTTLFAAIGRFSDGAPPGGQYGASSACSWSLAPGYAYVRLNFTRFATEEGFDYVTVLAVHDDGGTELLQKLSGTPLQVRLAHAHGFACVPRRARSAD